MARNQIKSHRLAQISLQRIFNEKAISEALAHFFVIYFDKAVVQPVFSHALTLGAAALRGLVFVMRKEQIKPARVDIDLKFFAAR